MSPAVLEVVRPGSLTLVEDLGRPGYGEIGVGPSGAADRAAFRLGARLVGNPVPLAALEITLGGLQLRAHGTCVVAVTGAMCPASVDGRPAAYAAAVVLSDGQLLTLDPAPVGLRCYLSVRGGIDVPAVLGSRSTDTLSGLGPAPVRAGDRLPVGPALPSGYVPVDVAAAGGPSGSADVEVSPGPRLDWLADPAALLGSWQVAQDSDRVAVRLTGAALAWTPQRVGTELASEPIVAGAVQLPPAGRPVVFLADHPTTGGYPVVAVVDRPGLDRLAQARPGDVVRLRRRSGTTFG